MTTRNKTGARRVLVVNPDEMGGSGGGTVTQGDPQSDTAKPWLVKLLSAGSDVGAALLNAIKAAGSAVVSAVVIAGKDDTGNAQIGQMESLGGGLMGHRTASYPVGPTVVAPGAAFPATAPAVQPCDDGAGKAQPIFQGSGTMAQAARVTLATDGPGVANLSAMAQNLPGLDLPGHLSTVMGSAVPALVCAARVAGVHSLQIEPLGTPSSAPLEARVRFLKSTPTAVTKAGGATDATITVAASTTVTLTAIHFGDMNCAIGQFFYNAADTPDFAERITAIGGGGGSAVTLTLANAYGGTLGAGNASGMVFGVADAAATNGTNLAITAGANTGKVLGVTQPECNVKVGMRVYITADGATKAVRVLTAVTSGSDTALTFAQAYRGAGSAGAPGSILSGYVLRPPQSSNAPTAVPYGPLAVNDVLVGYADAAFVGCVVSAARVSA